MLRESDNGIMTNHCENENGRETQQREDIVLDRGPTIKPNERENLLFSLLCCRK